MLRNLDEEQVTNFEASNNKQGQTNQLLPQTPCAILRSPLLILAAYILHKNEAANRKSRLRQEKEAEAPLQ